MTSKTMLADQSSDMNVPPSIGVWVGNSADATFLPLTAGTVHASIRQPGHLLYDPDKQRYGLATGGEVSYGTSTGKTSTSKTSAGQQTFPLLGILPPLYPEWLGDRGFQETHGLRFAYVGGAMARGIASAKLVIALGQMGAMGMFGAAGLAPKVVEAAITEIAAALDPLGLPWGSNLIHSPNEPALENDIVALYLRCGVRKVSASAYMSLTPAIVRYACSGLQRSEDGAVIRKNYIFAKISREEVAKHFLSPAPQKILQQLLADNLITAEEAEIAAELPLSEDIIVESDSGGHTDNRPLNALFPAIMTLRDQLSASFGYNRPIRLGAAGSLGTPVSVAAAYSLGAAFVLLGSVHQSAVESGISDSGRELLAKAELADVAMTASADMFELGVKVQVLQRGTMMAVRGNQLYDLYTRYDSIDDIPIAQRENIEKNIFRQSLDEIWQQTERFFKQSNPAQLERALQNPKHKMALIFRWYIGNSSQWPISGEVSRQIDYQLWCGPAMGAFNRWVAGSFLQAPEQRTVQQIALNLLEGAAQVTRVHQLRTFGLAMAQDAMNFTPTVIRT
ncbi:MAG: PfaD family polyunsaturated fatty acid/polyketide biosynthesis protein [Pseudomonadales bacterium]|nr:PfaD family polyunsaturated fatty acid/polyketide biosynthesis protein [Pseudomonadales bacterium]